MSYTHFTLEERKYLQQLLSEGYSFRKIAAILERSPSTISREVNRNKAKYKPHNKPDNKYWYNHWRAQNLYIRRRREQVRAALQPGTAQWDYIVTNLQLYWTPEEIAGRAKLEEDFSISYNTIYRAVDSGLIPKAIKKFMRFKSKRNKKRRKDDKRGRISDTVSISERPEEVETRLTFGHWEGDTVLGKRKTGCIGTLVERASGFTLAFKLDNAKAENFNKAAVKAFSSLPKILKKTLTVDNGTEFMLHKELAKALDMDIYFCDPYSPWQRGSNENTNGLLRQFFPKNTSFKDVSDEQISIALDLINNRPRKRFGFRSPAEVLNNFFTLYLLHLN